MENNFIIKGNINKKNIIPELVPSKNHTKIGYNIF